MNVGDIVKIFYEKYKVTHNYSFPEVAEEFALQNIYIYGNNAYQLKLHEEF